MSKVRIFLSSVLCIVSNCLSVLYLPLFFVVVVVVVLFMVISVQVGT